jgi:broad specificity phosphatase PhoE
MKTRTFLLLRHPEAWKTVEDRHGGEGTNLTSKGFQQCDAITHYILTNHGPVHNAALVGHRAPQVHATVQHLSMKLGIRPTWDERLHGIGLGVLSGLSRAEAVEQWPNEAKRLELWRKGKLSIDDLRIPQAEPFDKFHKRVESVLADWLSMTGVSPLVAVCTRSVLIMLVNLIELADEFNSKRYRVYDFHPGSITEVEVAGARPQLVNINHIDHWVAASKSSLC